MVKDFFNDYVYPITMVSGGIVGVGFLSLPYIASQVGLLLMLLYIVVLTVLVTSIHMMFGRISLKTPDYKRFPGFVEFYFGKFAKDVVLVTMTLGSFGVMLVYLIVASQFLMALIGPFMGGNAVIYVMVFLVGAATFIYFGARGIARADFLALALLLCSFLLIAVRGMFHMTFSHVLLPTAGSNWKTLFLPYGAIIFSLWGVGLIPDVEEMVSKKKSSLKKIIIIGTLIPALFYFLFTLLVLGISGNATTESALTGLQRFLGSEIYTFVLFSAAVVIFTAFISQGLSLKKIFVYDAKINERYAWGLVCMVPLILFLLGLDSFIPLISFLGGFLLSFDGIMVLLMYKKIGGKDIVTYPLMLVFLLAMAYEIIYVIK
jgi:amino acid permease